MNLKHLISQKGILINFSVAKKISAEKIKSLELKIKKKMKPGDDLQSELNHQLAMHTQKTLNINDIPGIINNSDTNTPVHNDYKGIYQNESKAMMLNLFGTTLAKKLISQKFKKDEVCFVILTILSALGLTDQDFKQFHKNNSHPDANNSENDYDDEDDEDDVDDEDDEEY